MPTQKKSCILVHAQSNMQLGNATVKRFQFLQALYRPVPLLPKSLYKLWRKTRRERWPCPPPSRFGEFNMAWYAYCLTEHQTLPNGTRTRRPFLLEGVQGV